MQANDVISSIKIKDVRAEAFKRKFFDFIVDTPKGRHEKQRQAFEILTDSETDEFAYGGAAGGAKSWTGCCWLLFQCWAYPGVRGFIGREELKRITESTLITFFKVAAAYGFVNGVDFKYNGQKNFIQFSNGSRIDLLELKYLPRDPMYERFGSTEYTFGWIEESGEINFGAYEVLKTRVGRHFNDRYGLIAKLFLTCNPKKNWLYQVFYKPHKEGKLPTNMKYLQAFVTDNPHIDSGYVKRLDGIKDKAKKARLRDGDWDYDDDPTVMCSYDNVMSMFTNTHVQRGTDKYITADVARFGSDKARIGVWYGWVLVEKHEFAISATTDIQDCINAMRVKHGIPANHCIADEDGVGGGVVDNCGIVGFVNNAKPITSKESAENKVKQASDSAKNIDPDFENYQNLQTQCAYKVAEVINEHGIYLECVTLESEKEEIAEEFAWLKTYKTDEERKLRILPKDEVKKAIGRSPDWRDLILMKYYFELKPAPKEMSWGW